MTVHAITLGGGQMNNPGRYLTLLPAINGATATSGTPYFTENAGDAAQAHDMTFTYDYMPSQFITFRLEEAYRYSAVPYWTGRRGVTPPGGNNGNRRTTNAQQAATPAWGTSPLQTGLLRATQQVRRRQSPAASGKLEQRGAGTTALCGPIFAPIRPQLWVQSWFGSSLPIHPDPLVLFAPLAPPMLYKLRWRFIMQSSVA